MANYRVTIFLIIAVGIIATTILLIQIGSGYRPDISNGTITPTGLLSATSDPKGAQVYVNRELKTATDDTISLNPDTYQIQIKKDGFIPWTKNVKIERSLVAQTNATLFPVVPDLKALTYTGAQNPQLSPNGTRMIYAVNNETPIASPSTETSAIATSQASLVDADKIGLWLLELADLPLGFSRDPQQAVEGEISNYPWSEAEFKWSPDSREILASFWDEEPNTTTPKAETKPQNALTPTPTPNPEKDTSHPTRAYRIQLGQTIPANQLRNIADQYPEIILDWEQDNQEKINRQLSSLPTDLNILLSTASGQITFSPDETKLMYIATASAQLADNYIPPVLATNSQPQNRILETGNVYVYDTKEDVNFLIDHLIDSQSLKQLYSWFPTSQHLIKAETDKITILEYDNTNHATVYSSNLPIQVFPHPSDSKIIVLTTLNPYLSPTPNLYTLLLR